MCVFVPVWVYENPIHSGDQGVSDSLELELQAIVGAYCELNVGLLQEQ